MIWLLFVGMTTVVAAVLVWPLWRARADAGAPRDLHLVVYQAQLAEIDRDAAAGVIASADAGFARTEAARRLIAESGTTQSLPTSSTRRAVATGAIVACCAAGAVLYAFLGSPLMPDAPLSARASPPADISLESAVARIENHLAKEPDDVRGWTIIAPVYLRSGRGNDAVIAYGNVLRLAGESAERRADYGEAQVYASQGMVTADAKRTFEAALTQDPTVPKARYYLGIAAAQDGDQAKAKALWSGLASEQTADSPLKGLLERRLAELGAIDARTDMARDVAALPAEQQTTAIRGMVEQLASRLRDNGADIEGWLRLVRAYRVLEELPKARAALTDARRQFAGDTSALSRLDDLAHELGIDS